ncbi:hypothetical protein ANO14919_126570 [Xylariales sp. No.14919]|nr:hypothetical protein ANO14919_126570 [Xylariales sp. No.14919]
MVELQCAKIGCPSTNADEDALFDHIYEEIHLLCAICGYHSPDSIDASDAWDEVPGLPPTIPSILVHFMLHHTGFDGYEGNH